MPKSLSFCNDLHLSFLPTSIHHFIMSFCHYLSLFFALGHVPPAQNKNVALSLATFQQQFPLFFRMQHHVCSELSQVQYHLLIMETIFWNLIPISFNKCALLGCLEFFHFINYLKNVTNLRWHLRKVQKENTSLKIEWENQKRNNFAY